mmetsp:Transcript_41392/g.69703  ORF Transcript_41392/g.69703 Transcript_41392/m.69703 type:complete len:377 (+) Transcript_41392:90-1220(+)
MGGKPEGNGSKPPFFTVPFSPFFRGSKIFPPVPFIKMNPPHSPTAKWDFLPLTDTHRHGGQCGCLRPVPQHRPKPSGQRPYSRPPSFDVGLGTATVLTPGPRPTPASAVGVAGAAAEPREADVQALRFDRQPQRAVGGQRTGVPIGREGAVRQTVVPQACDERLINPHWTFHLHCDILPGGRSRGGDTDGNEGPGPLHRGNVPNARLEQHDWYFAAGQHCHLLGVAHRGPCRLHHVRVHDAHSLHAQPDDVVQQGSGFLEHHEDPRLRGRGSLPVAGVRGVDVHQTDGLRAVDGGPQVHEPDVGLQSIRQPDSESRMGTPHDHELLVVLEGPELGGVVRVQGHKQPCDAFGEGGPRQVHVHRYDVHVRHDCHPIVA